MDHESVRIHLSGYGDPHRQQYLYRRGGSGTHRKSTFIKRFMETQVLPNIDDSYRRDRARDELPQSGSGRTIMTAEPKFVPEEAVEVCMEEGVTFSVRLIDCVGYMVPGAVGQYEDLSPRMVMTPGLTTRSP